MAARELKNFLDINEHRKSLNRLEEDIERELAGDFVRGFADLIIVQNC